MKKEIKLIKKVKHLLEQMHAPKWLHHFGPKTYEFWQHFTCLLAMVEFRMSFRRIVKIFDLLGLVCPSKSALHYTRQRIKGSFFESLLKGTHKQATLVAIDSTGFSRQNPSFHYLNRIDAKIPKGYAKLNTTYDIFQRKFCSAKIRVLPAHDMRDALVLIRKTKGKIVVADKGYNAESLYRYAEEHNFVFMSPWKKKTWKGWARNKQSKYFQQKVYNKRSLIEAGFGSLKRKYGSSVSSRSARGVRAEINLRMICHNIFQMLWVRFRTEPLL